jgi:predicted nucleotidyltransferase
MADVDSGIKTIPMQHVVDDVVHRLVTQFSPLKIILFGSHAIGNPTDDSDLDFLIVMPDGTDRRQSAIEMHRHLRDLPMPKDLIVTTPQEIARRGQMIGSILQPALAEGKVLYER